MLCVQRSLRVRQEGSEVRGQLTSGHRREEVASCKEVNKAGMPQAEGEKKKWGVKSRFT